MASLLADALSDSVIWVLAGVGVAALVAGVMIAWASNRSSKRQPPAPARANGFAFEAPVRTDGPSRFQAAEESEASPEDASRTVDAEAAEPQAPPRAPEWMALWAARGEEPA